MYQIGTWEEFEILYFVGEFYSAKNVELLNVHFHSKKNRIFQKNISWRLFNTS